MYLYILKLALTSGAPSCLSCGILKSGGAAGWVGFLHPALFQRSLRALHLLFHSLLSFCGRRDSFLSVSISLNEPEIPASNRVSSPDIFESSIFKIFSHILFSCARSCAAEKKTGQQDSNCEAIAHNSADRPLPVSFHVQQIQMYQTSVPFRCVHTGEVLLKPKK